MPIRRRGQFWHYRFTIAGQECAGSTKLRATEANRKAAERIEKAERSRVIEGRAVEARKDFATAAGEFVSWCKDVQYRNKPNTAKRIAVSFASLVEFMGGLLVPSIEEAEVEQYKLHRVQVNGVKDVTLRHDLHSLSLFFQYAERMRWREGNPVRKVKVPSDSEAVRINPPSMEEEEAYFKAAFKVIDKAGRRNLYDVAKIMREQGCRPEEVMASLKSDFDPEPGTY